MTEYDPSEPLLMTHEYDGIREFDNPLPGWWRALFWISILFCGPYALWYHFGNGVSIQGEYQQELADQADRLIQTYGKLTPDEKTLLRFMDDKIAMAGMGALFRAKCAQCHNADGSGNVGPNLTDDSWINVKTLTDLPTVIANGVAAKGMPSWKGQLADTQIVLLGSYVAQLRLHPVAGKAPQGNPIPAWPAAAAAPAGNP